MTLNDVFDALIYGELSRVFVDASGEPVTELPVNRRKQIVSSVQLGLTELHKRFLLREHSFVLELIEGRRTYLLDSKYAQSNARSQEAVKYINDAEEPFTGSLFKIERAYDALGTELSINLIGDVEALRTPSPNSLWVPDTLTTATISVVYRANHEIINAQLAIAAPGQVQLSLPMTHLEPLLFYVAARVTRPKGMQNEFHEGASYGAQFEQSCARLLATDFQVEVTSQNTRLERNGWV